MAIKGFISYSHRDGRAFRDALVLQLAAAFADGVATFWSDEGICAGERWDDEIRFAIDQADIGLFILTPFALQPDGYIRTRELPRCAARGDALLLVPVLGERVFWRDHEHLKGIQPLPSIDGWARGYDGLNDWAADCVDTLISLLRQRGLMAPESGPVGAAFAALSALRVALAGCESTDLIGRLDHACLDLAAALRQKPATLRGLLAQSADVFQRLFLQLPSGGALWALADAVVHALDAVEAFTAAAGYAAPRVGANRWIGADTARDANAPAKVLLIGDRGAGAFANDRHLAFSAAALSLEGGETAIDAQGIEAALAPAAPYLDRQSPSLPVEQAFALWTAHARVPLLGWFPKSSAPLDRGFFDDLVGSTDVLKDRIIRRRQLPPLRDQCTRAHVYVLWGPDDPQRYMLETLFGAAGFYAMFVGRDALSFVIPARYGRDQVPAPEHRHWVLRSSNTGLEYEAVCRFSRSMALAGATMVLFASPSLQDLSASAGALVDIWANAPNRVTLKPDGVVDSDIGRSAKGAQVMAISDFRSATRMQAMRRESSIA